MTHSCCKRYEQYDLHILKLKVKNKHT